MEGKKEDSNTCCITAYIDRQFFGCIYIYAERRYFCKCTDR